MMDKREIQCKQNVHEMKGKKTVTACCFTEGLSGIKTL